MAATSGLSFFYNIMKIIIITILCGLLASCHQMYYVHPDFVPYVDAFIQDAALYNKELPTDNVVMDYRENESKLGTGVTMVDQNFVYVNEDRFKALSNICKEVFLYHELGHVWLDRAHTSSGIMQPNSYPPCNRPSL